MNIRINNNNIKNVLICYKNNTKDEAGRKGIMTQMSEESSTSREQRNNINNKNLKEERKAVTKVICKFKSKEESKNMNKLPVHEIDGRAKNDKERPRNIIILKTSNKSNNLTTKMKE